MHNLGNRILIITASHTGNNIFCTPSIRLIKKFNPFTRIDVVALNTLSAEVFYGNKDIETLWVANKKTAINKIAKDYTAIICMNDKSNFLIEDIQENIFKLSLSFGSVRAHSAERLLQATALMLGCTLADADRAYVFNPYSTDDSSALQGIDINPHDILVGIHLGCGRTATQGWKFWYKGRSAHHKLWPAENYIQLANELIQANPNIRIVITGTRNEAFLGKQFINHVPRTINLIGKTNIAGVVTLMDKLDLFISQDCGILHVAASTSVPLIGLYGSTNPIDTGPYPTKSHHIVIKNESMELITINEVTNIALSTLSQIKTLKHANVTAISAWQAAPAA